MEWRISKEYIDYNLSLEEMKQRVQAIINREKEELIWFLEHFPVYTAGSSALESEFIGEIPKSHNMADNEPAETNIKNRNTAEGSIIPVIQTGRGGKYTYHGPGQRVVYLLLDLRKRNLCDLKKYIFLLEEIIIIALQKLAPRIKTYRKADYIGVWVISNGQEKKIAAIGVRVTKWVTYHGLAINISPNLSNYQRIIPCGIKDFQVTSLAELEENISMSEFDIYLKRAFIEVLRL